MRREVKFTVNDEDIALLEAIAYELGVDENIALDFVVQPWRLYFGSNNLPKDEKKAIQDHVELTKILAMQRRMDR